MPHSLGSARAPDGEDHHTPVSGHADDKENSMPNVSPPALPRLALPPPVGHIRYLFPAGAGVPIVKIADEVTFCDGPPGGPTPVNVHAVLPAGRFSAYADTRSAPW